MAQKPALLTATPDAKAIPVRLVNEETFEAMEKADRHWAKANRFDCSAGTSLLLPGTKGIKAVMVGTGGQPVTPWTLADAVAKLGEGTYVLEGVSAGDCDVVGLGWCLAQYRFGRYLSDEDPVGPCTLIVPESTDIRGIERKVAAISLVRDLVNTPAEHMGPADLQDAAEALAEAFGGTCGTTVGDDLLDDNLPAIHAVGRAAGEGREPRLIDLRWGDKGPKLTLVGKGVCFDTGGLDIKPASGMLLMKKDMGGAAHALAMAQLVMASKLKVQLRVLVPAVENAVNGNAYRPGDIISTRKGLSVEIGNTDAEGRVVLCDALALACEGEPDLLIDFATLTGAARVALGPDLPATYTNDDAVWASLETAAKTEMDPLWRLPLWAPYDAMLDSDIADVNNSAEGGFAGSITAALYLQRFIEPSTRWVHFDVFSWIPKPKPGRPKGGEAQGLRATFAAIKDVLSLDD